MLLGGRSPSRWWGVGVQLLILWLWYPAIVIACDAVVALGLGFTPDNVLPAEHSGLSSAAEEWIIFLSFCGLGGPLAGGLAYALLRVVTRSEPPPVRLFVRHAWRTCLLLTLALPVAAMATRCLGPRLAELIPMLLILGSIVGPALLAYHEIRRGRPSRWRPVCPECGYSLRRLTAPRCPECGEGLPAARGGYRRWAMRRLDWDRRARGSLLFSYVRTVAQIAVCPCRAAQALALPDRLPRAAVWALVHVCLLALAGACVSVVIPVSRYRTFYEMLPEDAPSPGRMLLWAAQTFGAWFAVGASWAILGILASVAVPGRHPVARAGTVKWSLYATALPCWTLPMVIAAASVIEYCRYGTGTGASWLQRLGLPAVPTLGAALLYGLWWARGCAVHPYLKRRGTQVWLLHVALYAGAWLVARILFVPGKLEYLL